MYRPPTRSTDPLARRRIEPRLPPGGTDETCTHLRRSVSNIGSNAHSGSALRHETSPYFVTAGLEQMKHNSVIFFLFFFYLNILISCCRRIAITKVLRSSKSIHVSGRVKSGQVGSGQIGSRRVASNYEITRPVGAGYVIADII